MLSWCDCSRLFSTRNTTSLVYQTKNPHRSERCFPRCLNQKTAHVTPIFYPFWISRHDLHMLTQERRRTTHEDPPCREILSARSNRTAGTPAHISHNTSTYTDSYCGNNMELSAWRSGPRDASAPARWRTHWRCGIPAHTTA